LLWNGVIDPQRKLGIGQALAAGLSYCRLVNGNRS
jgi:hypothetical protein